MSTEARLMAALAPLGLPVSKGTYSGTEDTYLVYGYSTLAAGWGNDCAIAERALIHVHLWAKAQTNTTALRRSIKRQLAVSGYSWPSMTDVSDGSLQHYVFDTEEVEGIGEDAGDGAE